MGSQLTGTHWVLVLGAAIFDAKRLWPRTKDRMIVRRHALKLRFWPERHPEDEHGEILDLDWSWVKAMKGLSVGELRIDETIGQRDNIRLMFFAPGVKRDQDPKPVIWILQAMQKKRDEFTSANVRTFHARRQLVLNRFYGQ